MEYGDKITRYAGYNWRKHITLTFRFRMDPVPYTRKRKGSYFKCYYKTPRSTQERRRFYMDKEFIRIRGKRVPCYLPNAWDDYPRADVYDRSWKRATKRKRQWKGK